MTEVTFPLIIKALSSASDKSGEIILLSVQTDTGEVCTLEFSLSAAIATCALLLGHSKIEQAIGPKLIEKDQTDRSSPLTDRCSFCGKASSEVEKLVAGVKASICNECIDLCLRVMSEKGNQR